MKIIWGLCPNYMVLYFMQLYLGFNLNIFMYLVLSEK